MNQVPNLRVQAGEPLRIEGHRFLAGRIVEGGRMFLEPETGCEAFYSNVAQIKMARDGRMTTEAMWRAQSEPRRLALQMDLDSFSPAERELMQWRHRYVKAVNELPRRDRRKKAEIKEVIKEIAEKHPHAFGTPSERQVATWHSDYEAAGRDIRALASFANRMGGRQQLPDWMHEQVVKAIYDTYAKQPPGTLAATRRRAIDLIRACAKRDGREIPYRGQKKGEVLGVNVVSRALKGLNAYDILLRREGKAEADRLMSMVATGPQGEWPLSAVEVDHTPLDILVIDEVNKTVLGRPTLTTMLDRYSRCVIGFSLAFHPPSWVSVMETLRIAVCSKEKLLEEVGGIHQPWPCCGVPDELVADNGKEFHSISMDETEAALNMRVLYLPRKKSWLKGKIERWFRTLEDEIIHTIPGTTLSNVVKRGDYQSEDFAVLSIRQTEWLITKWVVDVYHQEEHTATGEVPAERWEKGMYLCGPKLAPPPGLLVPLTGKVVYKQLTRHGIKAEGLNWDSLALEKLRARIGHNQTVTVRIDPLDLSHVYVHDEDRRVWIEGDLKSAGVADGLTLHQYEVIKKRARETKTIDEDRLEALSRARTEIFDYVDAIVTGKKKSKVGKRFARFAHGGRRPSDHIAPTRIDPALSARSIGSHPIDSTPSVAAAALPPPKAIAKAAPKTTLVDTIAAEALLAAPVKPLPFRIRKNR